MRFVDTHCHIHEALARTQTGSGVHDVWQKAGKLDPDALASEAYQTGVEKLICVGTTQEDSQLAVEFAAERDGIWASIGIHPHEAAPHLAARSKLQKFRNLLEKTQAGRPKIVAIGECGLDYFYEHSPKDAQKELLRFQLELAVEHALPVIFHVREAFDDFWPIVDAYPNVEGVIHSFSATEAELKQILERNLYVGLNGIMTFTKDEDQLRAAQAVPLERLLLETDAPYLTPVPFRGKVCEPKHVRVTAEFLSDLRQQPLEDIAAASTENAQTLFKI